jgi:hypothetical protein
MYTPAGVELPLLPYAHLTVDPGMSEEQRDAYKKWFDASQNYLASCMAAAGFEHYPEEFDPGTWGPQPIEGAFTSLALPLLAEDRSEVEKRGYGLTDAAIDNDQSEQGKNPIRNLHFVYHPVR